VRRVLYAREAFPVKHEVLRATCADSARESWKANRETGNLAADRIELSAGVLGPNTNDPDPESIKIRRPVSATLGQMVLSEPRWSLL
jgi:hypothetical protein